MISDTLYKYALSDKSVSSELANNPNEAPGSIVKRLFGRKHEAEGENIPEPTHEKSTEADLQRALECGKFGNTRPSNLFLKVRTVWTVMRLTN